MNYMDEYRRWCEAGLEAELKAELETLTSDAEIEDRFYRSLEFGTAGLRGVLGVGTNRMNIYTVRQATKGLADYICSLPEARNKGVVIAYDSRIKSDEFAMCAALVLCKCGIKTYLFDKLRPVPMLSFAVRNLGCTAGIVITASHNPPEYNGYKVYWSDGGQITPENCKPITECIAKIDVLNVEFCTEAEAKSRGLLEYVGETVDRAYYEYTKSLAMHNELTDAQKAAVKVVYTPLHGSGLEPVTRLLSEMGYENVYVVEEQRLPDGKFPTVKAPNPENRAAFDLALELAKKNDADMALATDPDADRLGVCINEGKGGYKALTGNTIGAFLIYYILSALNETGDLERGAFVVESIVSTRLAQRICESYGVELKRVLTGFRYIAEQIEKSECSGEGRFIFGFEESYGFLAGTCVRDKDACLSAMLMCEACAYYKTRGKELAEVITDIETKYGAYAENCTSFNVQGKNGMAKLGEFMEKMHKTQRTKLAGRTVTRCIDYEKGETNNLINGTHEAIDLPRANVISYDLGDDVWVCMRPSGTEPKLKVYVGVRGKNREEADKLMNLINEEVTSEIEAALR